MKKLIMMVELLPMMALAATWHVNGSMGSDSNLGTSESTPMATIQAAIDVADDGDTILVAPGTYAPITTENKNIAIRSITGAISTVIDGGNTNRCVKVLPKSFSGNLQYVVCTNTCIYGFTLQNGYAGEDGDGWKELGLGGGGLCGTYYNCIFLDNKSRGGGGCDSAILHNCLLSGNYAINGGGGDGCIFKNCTIVNNRCKDNGAGTFGSVLENCIAYGNVGNTQYYNVSAWMNDLVRLYCNDFHRTNVFEDDPSFVDATNGDYRLAAGSPCIDAGDNSYVMTAADLDGNIRIANGTVDVGCYEYNSTTVLPPTAMYTVTFDANGGDGGWTGIMDYGAEIVAPTVTRDGYIFVGWSPSVAATVPANDVTYTAQWMKNMIRNVTAKQRYPWNGKVDVSFEVVGDLVAGLPDGSTPVLTLSATDRTTGSNYVAKASMLSGDTGTAEGAHRVVWDMKAQGLDFVSDDVVITVSYKEQQYLYCVIDLSPGASAASYPVSYLSDVPGGGWTDEYKTTKLVLRLIEPGTIPTRDAAITKPFYMGVFEVTQKQYELVMGSNPSYYKGDMRPVESVSWNTIRGNSSTYNWPSVAGVDPNSFMGRIQTRTGLNFDLPTEAQWEYACRAGTTSSYNNGGDLESDLKQLGRYYNNRSDGKGGYSDAHATVGSYLPNAWGLYDMHGNVWEWCLDWYGGSLTGNDPVGSSSGSYRVFRGCCWGSDADSCTSSNRGGNSPSSESNYFGFRLVRTLSTTEGERSPEAVAGAERVAKICAGDSTPIAVDLASAPLVDSISVSWDASWVGGDASATVVIADNGTEIKRTTGEGEFMYSPSEVGRHELTYTTLVDEVAQDEVYTATVFRDWKYEVREGGAVIAGTTQTEGDVVIPSEIDGYLVTGIDGAFVGCSGLTSITMPGPALSACVPGFYEAEFLNAYSLDGEVSIVDNARAIKLSAEKMTADTINAYTMYAYGAYMYFKGGVTYHFVAVYDDCSSIKVEDSMVISPVNWDWSSEKQTGSVSFSKSGWRWVELRGHNYGGPGATNYGRNEGLLWWTSENSTRRKFEDSGDGLLFRACQGGAVAEYFPDAYAHLETIVLTGEPTEIPAHAFEGCAALREFEIPTSVTNIGASAFAGCASLTSISIPGSVTSIGEGAFANCTGLRRVEVAKTMQSQIESRGVFDGCSEDLEIIYISPEIRNVTVRSRNPWGKVDVSFEVVGDVMAGLSPDACLGLSVSATDRTTGSNYVASASALSGDTGTAEGLHHVVWDLNAQGLELNSEDIVFMVAYAEPSLYCVIDLSAGANATAYPVSYLAGVPEGGWSDEYKTSKLVLRRIEPGDIPTRDARITKPFYCGMFEVTQKQWELVMGSNPSQYQGDMRPVERVSYNMIRGSSAGSQWPASSAVDGSSFMGKIREKTGIEGLDLTTEAQWEYACRAGTTSKYNNGGDSVDDMRALGRYNGNTSDGKGGYSQQTTVGSYLPNAWGLYDMHGNVWEICLDWSGNQLSGDDPVGASSGSYRVFRGGSWRNDANTSSSQNQGTSYASSTSNDFGFRLANNMIDGSSPNMVFCSADSAAVAIDSRDEPVVDSVVVAWDASWVGGDENATVVIEDNGAEVKSTTGAGEFVYTLSEVGRHELTYTTLVDEVAQDVVYSATLFKDWKYEVRDGGAVIDGTTQTEGDVVIPSEIDGYLVTGIDGAFVGCSGIKSMTLPSTISHIAADSFAGCVGLTNLVIESDSVMLCLPGLKQAKFNTRFDITSTIDDSDEVAEVSGVIAAYQKVTESPWQFVDPSTGDAYAWNDSSSTFAYFGEMHMDAGKTYVFGAHFDDDVYVKVDGRVLINIFNSSSSALYTGSYLCTTSGWYDVEFRLGDNYGGKGSWGNMWGSDFGLGYRDDGGTSATQSQWKRLIDPGDASLFRCDGEVPFGNCSNLKSLRMPWGLVSQLNIMFPDSHDNLEAITLTGESTEIPAHAFEGCAALREFEIPTSVTNIGASAFAGCASLTSISIPGGVTSIGRGAFAGCGAMTSISVAANSATYSSVNGMLLSKDETMLFAGVNGVVTVPDTVTRIEDLAFEGRNGITSVTMPVRFRSQFGEALNDCPITYIGKVRFDAEGFDLAARFVVCGSALGELSVLDSPVGYSFAGWFTEKTGGEQVTAKTIVIDDMMLHARWTANVYEVTFDAAGGVAEPANKGVSYDAAYGELPILTREGYTFAGWMLDGEDVTATTVVKTAGNHTLVARWTANEYEATFDAAGGVMELANKSVTYDMAYGELPTASCEGYVFLGWTLDGVDVTAETIVKTASNHTLTAKWGIQIGNGIWAATISDEPITLCEPLVPPSGEVVIPATIAGRTVVGITDAAFAGNTTVTGVTVRLGVEGIADGVLGDTPLTVVVEDDAQEIPSVVKENVRAVVFADGVTRIPDNYFAGCLNLETFDIAESVVRIGTNVFEAASALEMVTANGCELYQGWCLGLADDEADLYDITIPDGVRGIAAGAFEGEWGIESVEFPATLRFVGAGAFKDCTDIEDIALPDGVVAVDRAAFRNCTYVQELSLPTTLREIGDGAFANCTMLTELTLPDGVAKIGEVAFSNCWRITSATIPASVTNVGPGAFVACKRLTDVTLPFGVGTVQEVFPAAYDKITRVEIASDGSGETMGVPPMPTGMFAGCSKLTDIIWPEGFGEISAEAFVGCVAMTGFNLPSSVTNIGARAFAGLSIEEIVFPASVAALGASVFDGCSSLASVRFLGNAPAYDAAAYTGAPAELVTYVVKGSRGWDGVPTSKALPEFWPEGTENEIWFWTPTRRTVDFIAVDGWGAVTTQCVEQVVGAAYVLPDAPNMDGATFGGWWTLEEGGARVTASTLVEADGPTAFYARLTFERYTVTFDANGGAGAMAPMEMAVAVSAALPTCGFTRSGYTFVGWATEPDGEAVYDDAAVVVGLAHEQGATVVLYAKWIANRYAVQFDANGGEGAMEPVEMTVEVSALLPACGFARAGYTFAGWAMEAEGDVVYADAEGVVNLAHEQGAVVVLYAKWEEIRCVVTFDANGGEGAMAPMEMTVAVSAALPACGFARAGYTFVGWATEPDGEAVYDDAAVVAGLAKEQGAVVVLYAKWEEIRYVVTFDANGGAGAMEPVEMAVAVGAALPACGFACAGYIFVGWATAPEGEAVYDDAAVVVGLAHEQGATVVLYAKWEEKMQYAVTFDATGGSGGAESVVVVYGAALPTVTVPTRAGYTFGGYWLEADGILTQYFGSDGAGLRRWDRRAAATLSARWTADTITYTYQSVSGSEIKLTGYSGAVPADVTLPSAIDGKTVVGIGEDFMEECDGLVSLTLPGTIRFVCNSAFDESGNLAALNLNEGLETVGAKAFRKLRSLTSLSLPSTLREIGEGAFTRSNEGVVTEGRRAGINTLSIHGGDNDWFSASGGVLYDKVNKTVVMAVTGTGEITIPGGCEKIGENAFLACHALRSVSFPASLMRVAEEAFAGCVSLQALDFSGTALVSVGGQAFCGCPALKTAHFPATLAMIGASIFGGDNDLTSVTFDGNAPVIQFDAADDDIEMDGNPYAASDYVLDENGDWHYTGLIAGVTTYVNADASGWGIVPETWQSRPIQYLPDQISDELIPEIAADAAPEVVANAIEAAKFADEGVKEAIGGSAEEYTAFKTWAGSVKGATGNAQAGEAAVVASPHAAAAYLLGAERLFANAPTVEIGDVSVGDGESAGTTAMSIAVTVKDGESVVAVNAAKVRAMFEATSDLGDWNGAAKLTPEVTVEDGEGATMRFKVTPGDGTAPRAFLRIRK